LPRVGVGHPVQAISDVRRTDARRRERDTPEGVAQFFQVCVYKVDPRVCILARNLLSKNACRAALADEVAEDGPQVALVIESGALSCRAERLARAGAGPDRAIVRPSCKAQGEGPAADAGEEMTLGESHKLICSYILDAPFVHHARCNQPGRDQVAQPGCGARVKFVVIVFVLHPAAPL
jgi:hypothetical protein